MKAKLLSFFTCYFFSITLFYSQLGINTSSPNPDSVIDIFSEEKGVLLPRLNQSQIDVLTPTVNSNGLTVFNTTTNCYNIWKTNTNQWMDLCPLEMGTISFSNCNQIKVVGVYDMDKAVKDQTIRIEIPVSVTKLGKYQYSAEVNNVTFTAVGNYVNLGPQVVNLYVDPLSQQPSLSGIFSAKVSINHVEEKPSIDCTNTDVKFIKRSEATLKIVNISGNVSSSNTGLVSPTNYSPGTVYASVGQWLTGPGSITVSSQTAASAKTYSGTENIEIINVPVNNLSSLQDALGEASIIWVGASEDLTNGFVQLINEWFKSGRGILMITGDKIKESVIADAVGYYIEDGSATDGTTLGNNIPQIFHKSNGAPFEVNNNMTIGSHGGNCGYIYSNKGTPIMMINNRYPSAFADLDKRIFIFGDKFGSVSSGPKWDNFAYVLVDIFAWSLKNAPIY